MGGEEKEVEGRREGEEEEEGEEGERRGEKRKGEGGRGE